MADNNSIPLSKIEPLTGNNYYIWALKVSAILRSRRLFKPIIEGIEPADEGDPESAAGAARIKWEEQNDDAFGIIVVTLSPEQAGLFINERSAKKVWEDLKRTHAGNIEDKRIDMTLELKNLKMASDEKVDAYITRAKSIATKCASLGQVIQTRELVYYIVRGLNSKMENIAAVLRPQRSATLEEIQQALNEEEARLRESTGHKPNYLQSERAFKAKEGARGWRNPNTDRNCFICGKPGHIARNCWKRNETQSGSTSKFNQSNQKFQSTGNKNDHRKNEHAKIACENEQAFRAIEERTSGPIFQEKWNLDSGCTSHMTPHMEWMSDFATVHSRVNLAEEGRYIDVEGKGNVKVSTTTSDGEIKHICIHDVLYVPNLRTNLLSVRSLISQGNKVIFDTEGAKILNKQHEIVAEAKEKDRMYVLEAKLRTETENARKINCMNVETKDTGASPLNPRERWHKRLGHLNEEYLEKMQREKMVRGLEANNGKLGTCEACIMGKLTQTPFREIDSDGTCQPLELIHMDLCGPMPKDSIGGSRYFFVLVDSYSRRIFVEFLKSKDETFSKFVEFKNKRENEVKSKIRCVRSDNGTEFTNKQFEELFRNEGIHHQKTTPYTPQSNGVAERANRTLLEKARTLLIDSKLPNEFWAEAIATAAYAQNCILIKHGNTKTPMEMWNGKIPSVKHMRVFGSVAYYYVPKNLRTKLEPKAKKGIFVGYSRNRKAYRIFDPEDRKVHEARTVKFDENVKGGTTLGEARRTVTSQENIQSPEEEWMPLNMTEIGENGNVDVEQNEGNEILIPPDENVRRPGRKLGETNDVLKDRHLIARRENEERLIAEGARRSERIKGINQANMMVIEEPLPTKYEEAQDSYHKEEWRKAMDTEINLLVNHEVWKLVPRQPDMKVVKSKWVYTVKKNPDGTIDKRKARLVAAGYNQRAGIDFEESFSPVMKMESFRTLMAIAAHRKMKIRQYDVQTAYLYGEIKETVFMEQPSGYVRKGDEDKVCELQKSIYGLPQSGRNWNVKINQVLLKCGLTRLQSDPCLYIKRQDDSLFIMGLFVDDLIVIGSDDKIIDSVIEQVKEVFVITEKSKPEVFLGIEVKADEQAITLSQENYVNTILDRFGMNECNPAKTPGDPRQDLDQHEASEPVNETLFQEMIGSLMYLANGTRPDIAYNVSRLSQYLKNPKMIHLVAAKRVYRYLQGTRDKKLVYNRKSGKLDASADASWCNTADAKSFSGYTIKLGTSLVSWKSKKQMLVALSTCEAEMMALCEGVREIKWMASVLSEMKLTEYIQLPLNINSDSQAAIDWIKGIGPAARTKHINRKYYFIRDEYQRGNIEVNFKPSDEMEADFLTKSLCEEKFKKCNQRIGAQRHAYTKGELKDSAHVCV